MDEIETLSIVRELGTNLKEASAGAMEKVAGAFKAMKASFRGANVKKQMRKFASKIKDILGSNTEKTCPTCDCRNLVDQEVRGLRSRNMVLQGDFDTCANELHRAKRTINRLEDSFSAHSDCFRAQ